MPFERSLTSRTVVRHEGQMPTSDSPPRGERGATLLEAALSVVMFGSLLALANAIIASETARHRNIALGLDLGFMTESAQAFIAGEYETIKLGLAGLPQGEAAQAIPLQRLVSSGYLPNSFLDAGEHANSYGQAYRILVRGVNRADGNFPKATLAVSDIDSDSDGSVDGHLINGNALDGELDLESVLVSTGGRQIPPQHGNPAVVAAKTATVGFIQESNIARGPYGNWEMDIQDYAGLPGYPAIGRFVSLLSLSGHGVLGVGGNRTASGSGYSGHPFERCAGLSGALLSECAENNAVYTEIAFDSSSSNPNGYGKIDNVFTMEMGGEIDEDSDGTPEFHSAILDVSEISCPGGTSGTLASGTLLIDCPTGKFSGSLDVGASVSASRFLARSIGGQDLTKGVYTARVVSMQPETAIAKPVCSDPGSNPEIFAVPAAYASPQGIPLVGVSAFAVVNPDGDWNVRLEAAIDADEDLDGRADVVRLTSSDDYALVLTKCS